MKSQGGSCQVSFAGVQIQGRAEALDDRDSPAAPVWHAVVAVAAPLEPEHRADEHPCHSATENMIPGQHRGARGADWNPSAEAPARSAALLAEPSVRTAV